MKAFQVIFACCLFACLAPLPYGYFMFIRLGGLLFFAVLSFQNFHKDNHGKGLVYLVLALIFQPIAKIGLGREWWNVVDVLGGHRISCGRILKKQFFQTIERFMRVSLFLLLASIFLITCGRPVKDRKDGQSYLLVTKVVDGDTFWIINGDGAKEKIRLIGIDAPESRKTGKRKIGYFGKEAKEYLNKLLLNKKVRLEYDVQAKDKYKRTLAYVFMKDGTFVNELLVRTGYAVAKAYPPNVKYQDVLENAQRVAEESESGLWDSAHLLSIHFKGGYFTSPDGFPLQDERVCFSSHATPVYTYQVD